MFQGRLHKRGPEKQEMVLGYWTQCKKQIRRRTHRQSGAEEKIRIVLEILWEEASIAKLC